MNELLQYSEENTHPGFSIDCVILSFHKGKLKVLLREFGLNELWALLGGFMYNNENADNAAFRILEQHTGLKHIFLKQFHLFSETDRTIINQNVEFANQLALSMNDSKWFIRRFISMGYYALVKYEDVVFSHSKAKNIKWYDINNLPPLYSDHENIIKTAIKVIRAMLPSIPIGYELLPEKFTMTELRKIYEIFLGQKLDRRNFQRKILSESHVIQLKETKSDKAYNPSILYAFNSPDIDSKIDF